MTTEVLVNLGLSLDEAEIYLNLLERGPQTAIQIGKNTKVKRTYVYKVIQGLVAKGLASVGKSGSTTTFAPLSPDHLLNLAEARRQQAEAAVNQVESLLTSLKQKYSLIEEKPVVTYFEGVAGIKKAFTFTLEAKEPILALAGTASPDDDVWQWLRTSYIPMRLKANIEAKVIVSTGKKAEEYIQSDKQELRVTKVVPDTTYPLEHEINIYNDIVAILDYKKGETPLGIFIQNPTIAKTFKSWFKMTWENIK